MIGKPVNDNTIQAVQLATQFSSRSILRLPILCFISTSMPFVTTPDKTEIFYKDWGNASGKPIVFSHRWPLNSDNWENQMFCLANHGYRVIAHDRRGLGR